MSVLTKSKPRTDAQPTCNDLILAVEGLDLPPKVAKSVSIYLEDCRSFEASWDQLIQDRRELFEDCYDLTIRDAIDRADRLRSERDRLETELRALLQRRFEILPMLSEPYAAALASCKADLEKAIKDVEARFEKDGCGIEADPGFLYNPGAVRIRYRARCAKEPEALRVQARLNQLTAQAAGQRTQLTVPEISRDTTAKNLCRWPSVDPGVRKIAMLLEL